MSELTKEVSSKGKVKVSKSDFTTKVKAGNTQKELSELYNLPIKDIKEIATALDLKFTRKKVKYELVSE